MKKRKKITNEMTGHISTWSMLCRMFLCMACRFLSSFAACFLYCLNVFAQPLQVCDEGYDFGIRTNLNVFIFQIVGDSLRLRFQLGNCLRFVSLRIRNTQGSHGLDLARCGSLVQRLLE